MLRLARAGCELEIAIYDASSVDNLHVFVDENGCGRILAEKAAIEFLLGLEIIPTGVGLLGGHPKHAIFVTFARGTEGKGDGLAHGSGLLEENLIDAVLVREEAGGGPDAFGGS